MKIKGTCRRCGREFLVEQVIQNGGRCPWDGKPFQADYAVVVVDSLRDAETSGNTLENALEKVSRWVSKNRFLVLLVLAYLLVRIVLIFTSRP